MQELHVKPARLSILSPDQLRKFPAPGERAKAEPDQAKKYNRSGNDMGNADYFGNRSGVGVIHGSQKSVKSEEDLGLR